jgi:hypothetical protein
MLRHTSRDDGNGWLDLKASTSKSLRYCWNVKPARKHFERGHAKFHITFSERKYESENQINFDAPIFEGDLGWREQKPIPINTARINGWHLVGDAFWGEEIHYVEGDGQGIFDVSDEARTKGLITIRLQDPSRISALTSLEID